MIRMNLAPQQRKKLPRSGRKTATRVLGPALSGRASKWRIFAVAAWLLGPAVIGWTHLTGTREIAALEASIRTAQADSAQLAAIHRANAALRAREDTIRSRLEVISEIDHGRYVWAHIVDELSRLLPEHVWLTELAFLSNGTPVASPRFMINGRTGSTFALAELMRELESSPFLGNVTLVQTARVIEGEFRLFAFAVEASYRQPDPSLLDMRPVFAVETEE